MPLPPSMTVTRPALTITAAWSAPTPGSSRRSVQPSPEPIVAVPSSGSSQAACARGPPSTVRDAFLDSPIVAPVPRGDGASLLSRVNSM